MESLEAARDEDHGGELGNGAKVEIRQTSSCPEKLEQRFSKWGPRPATPHHLGLVRHTEDQAPPGHPESETRGGVQHVTGASPPADSDP